MQAFEIEPAHSLGETLPFPPVLVHSYLDRNKHLLTPQDTEDRNNPSHAHIYARIL